MTLWIALRHVWARLRQSVTTIASVAIGSAVLILAISIFDGLLQSFIDKLVDTGAHVLVEQDPAGLPPDRVLLSGDGVVDIGRQGQKPAEKELIRPITPLLAALRALPGVTAVAPEVSGQGILRFGTLQRGVTVTGIDPAMEAEIIGLDTKIQAGSYASFSGDPRGLLLGWRAASRLGVEVGDRVQVVSSLGGAVDFTVRGVFNTGINRLDLDTVFVSLARGQTLFQVGSEEASAISLRVSQPLTGARATARAAEGVTGHRARTWDERNASAIGIFQRIRFINFALIGFIALVAGFGVSNVVITVVLQKQKDIGILKSMGLTARQVVWIFVQEGMILAGVGLSIGLVLGYVGILALQTVPFESPDTAVFNPGTFPARMDPLYFISTTIIIGGVGMVAAWWPARRAGKLQPVETLRGER